MREKTRKWWVLLTICLLSVILNIDVTAVNLAIPTIANEMHASLANMQWVINAFVLLPAMFTILGGQFGDKWGHRKIFLIGTYVFVIASAIVGLAHNEAILIFGRALQGFALGIAYPMTLALVYDSFPKKQYGIAMGFIVGTMGLSLAVGPTLGGFITHYVGWRWIFLVNIPIGILTIILTYATCIADKPVAPATKFDVPGSLIFIIGTFFVIFALNQSQEWGITSAQFWLIFLMGILAFIALYFIEKRQKHPLIDFSLFRIEAFWINNLIRLIVQLVFIPVLFFIPIYLQNIAGYSAFDTGLIMLYLTVILGIISPLVGKWVDHVGAKIPNLASLFFYAIACALFYFLGPIPNFYILGSALFLVGVATSIGFVSTTAGCLSEIPENKTGIGSGIFFTVAWGSCPLGIALMGAILTIVGESKLTKELSQYAISLTSEQMAHLERVANGVAPLSSIETILPATDTAAITEMAGNAFIYGFKAAMIMLFVLTILGLILVIREKNVKKPARQVMPI